MVAVRAKAVLAGGWSEEKQEIQRPQRLACFGKSTWGIRVALKERGSGAKGGQEGLYSTLAICRYGCDCRIHTPFIKVLGEFLTSSLIRIFIV